MFKTTLLALDPRMKSVSVLSLSGSHLGPSLRTGLPALLTRIKSVLGRPKPEKQNLYNFIFYTFWFFKIHNSWKKQTWFDYHTLLSNRRVAGSRERSFKNLIRTFPTPLSFRIILRKVDLLCGF